jgi:hypothetical protein
MSIARARVVGRFDLGTLQEATVTIDRSRLLFSVRPLRRRRAYELPLAFVAEMCCLRVIRAELLERRRERQTKRRSKNR